MEINEQGLRRSARLSVSGGSGQIEARDRASSFQSIGLGGDTDDDSGSGKSSGLSSNVTIPRKRSSAANLLDTLRTSASTSQKLPKGIGKYKSLQLTGDTDDSDSDFDEDEGSSRRGGRGSKKRTKGLQLIGDDEVNESESDLDADGDDIAFASESLLHTSASTGSLVSKSGKEAKASNTAVFFNILKAFIGSGVLALPYSMDKAGLAGGIVGLTIVSIISVHCMALVIACKRAFAHLNVRTYGDLGAVTYGNRGKLLVDFAISFTQIGFCIIYLLFIGSNLETLYGLSTNTFVFLCLPGLILLSWFRSLAKLAPMSILGLISVFVGMGVVVEHAIGVISHNAELLREVEGEVRLDGAGEEPVDDPNHNALNDVKSVNWPTLPVFFGSAVYCFEGIGLIVPIEESMENPESFWTIFYVCMVIVTLTFIGFGSIGYVAFGDAVSDVITDNLPHNWLSYSVRIALCFSLYFTFPSQLFPAIQIIEKRVFGVPSKAVNWKRNLLRTSIVIAAGLIGVSLPSFGIVISLIGAIGCSLLAFILPAMFHLKSGEHSMGTKIKDWLIIIFGLAGMFIGTGFTIQHALSGED